MQVVRETLRVHAPVPALQRMAMQADVLPLGKPYIDKLGNVHNSLPYVSAPFSSITFLIYPCRIPNGQLIHISILGLQTDPEIWGADAAEFRYVFPCFEVLGV